MYVLCTTRDHDRLIQPVPIPSYLIAIAAGNLVYKAFPQKNKEKNGWTTGVWTEVRFPFIHSFHSKSTRAVVVVHRSKEGKLMSGLILNGDVSRWE